jgi:multidrug efflux system membrane fusion protein
MRWTVMSRWLTVFGAMAMAGSALAAEVAGTVQWAQRVELGAPVSGVVTRVSARPGMQVKKGDVLIGLDERRFRAELERARAETERLEQVYAEAQREQERGQELYDRTLLSDHELEVAKIGLATAAAEYQAARTAVKQAELDLEYSTVRAPFDAVVLAVHAGVGQAVAAELAAVPLVTVAEAGRRRVQLSVDHARASVLREGQSVPVRAGGAAYEGKITHVGLEPTPNAPSLAYPVDILIEAPESAGLRIGQPASVDLP